MSSYAEFNNDKVPNYNIVTVDESPYRASIENTSFVKHLLLMRLKT